MPRGRLATEHHSKAGQSWRSERVKACLIWSRQEVSVEASGAVRCPDCGDVVRFDERGYAACGCGLIWNDHSEPPMRKSDLDLIRVLRVVA